MKQTEYAAGVVSYYRKSIDKFLAEKNAQYHVLKQDYNSLLDLGNRCGFTNGYYYKHNDPSMVTYVKPNYATNNDKLHKEIFERYVTQKSQIPIHGYLYLRKGEEAVLTVSCDECSISKNGILVSEARNKPVTEDELDKRMRKTGDTPFVFGELMIDMEEGIFLPNGAVNQLRRDVLDALQGLMLEKYFRQLVKKEGKPQGCWLKKNVNHEKQIENQILL